MEKFKALPGSDDAKVAFGDKFDSWLVSDKSLSATEETREKALITYQKDSKDEALIGELRLFTKRLSKEAPENVANGGARIAKNQMMLSENTFFSDNGMEVSLSPQIKSTL